MGFWRFFFLLSQPNPYQRHSNSAYGAWVGGLRLVKLSNMQYICWWCIVASNESWPCCSVEWTAGALACSVWVVLRSKCRLSLHWWWDVSLAVDLCTASASQFGYDWSTSWVYYTTLLFYHVGRMSQLVLLHDHELWGWWLMPTVPCYWLILPTDDIGWLLLPQ